MKKITFLLVLFIIAYAAILTFSNCTAQPSQSIEATTHQHQWTAATCTEPQTCSVCKITYGSALGHTTSTGVCSRCGQDFGTWELSHYVDEFRNPTGENFIRTTVYGTFSNSATTNSDLTAVVQVDKEDVMIILYEYSQHMVKCSYKYDEFDITMLDSNNQKHYLKGTMYNGGYRIYIDDEYKSVVLNAFKGSGAVRFHIVKTDRLTSTYTFSVDTSNFSSLYKTLN